MLSRESGFSRVMRSLRVFLIAGLLVGFIFTAVPLRVALAYPNSWIITGGLSLAREKHTATLLLTGKVLVAGGFIGDNIPVSTEVYDPATGAWSQTGPMNTERRNHTATLLLNGQVLVAGGWNDWTSPDVLNSAELYNPATGTFTVTGSMTSGHDHHTATLLRNGQVLVAGGINNSGTAITVTELYDPATGIWSVTGGTNTPHDLHTATLLPNGKVLVAGGESSGSVTLNVAELFDPATGQWTTINTLRTSREAHTATLLANGKVLLVGGCNSLWCQNTLASAELYDPATGIFTPTTSMHTARSSHAATLLPSGKVLISGGWGGSSALVSSEVYDPATETWSDTVPNFYTAARQVHTATLLPGGRVLVAGGRGSSGDLSSAEVYDPAPAHWTTTNPLFPARRNHTATLLPGGQALIVGGCDGVNPLASAAIYDPTSDQWATTGSLNFARCQHTATLLPHGEVLVAGGTNGTPLTSAELYNPASGAFTVTGSLNVARASHTATLLPDGRVLVAGGMGSGGILTSTEIYDPSSRTWSLTGGLVTARYRHTATLLPDGNVLIVGGNDGGSLTSSELYDPASGSFTITGALNIAREDHSATLLPSGQVLVAGGLSNGSLYPNTELYDPVTRTFTYTVGSLANARYRHTATLLPGGRVLIAGGWSTGYLRPAQVYDPVMGRWDDTNWIGVARADHTATLLPDGRVLAVGGQNDSGSLNSAEVYDGALGFDLTWRPVVNTVNSPLILGTPLALSGSRLRGLSEASGGGARNSSTNYPLVQLRRVDNDQWRWLLPDSSRIFSDTAFTSVPITGFLPGPALMTVFVNGIPSASQVITVQAAPPGAPILMAPVSNTITTTQAITLAWQAGVGESPVGYNVHVDSSTITTTGTTSPTILPTGTHTWTVRAFNSAGYSGWAPARMITVTEPIPGVPVLLAPPNGTLTTTQAITFAWQAGTGGTPMGYNVAVDGNTITRTGTLSLTLLPYGSHTWQVRAYNATGYSDWASAWSVQVIEPASIPILLSPPNGSVTTTQAIIFAWQAGTGGTPAGYNVQMDGRTITTTETTSPTLLARGIHMWTVRAYNLAGYSAWATPAWSVEVTDTLPAPGVPILLSPPDGTITTTQAITLSWQTGVGGSPDGYHVQVDGRIITTTGTISPTLLLPGIHTWTVRAYNVAGHSDWAANSTVTVQRNYIYLPVMFRQ